MVAILQKKSIELHSSATTGLLSWNFEDLVLLNVLCDYNVSLKGQLETLKQDLGQEAILIVRAQVDFEVV